LWNAEHIRHSTDSISQHSRVSRHQFQTDANLKTDNGAIAFKIVYAADKRPLRMPYRGTLCLTPATRMSVKAVNLAR